MPHKDGPLRYIFRKEYNYNIEGVCMKKEVISNFKDKPINKSTWTGMWLGLASILIFPLLSVNAIVIRPMINNAAGETVGTAVTGVAAILCIALSVLAIIVNIKSFRKGERSWAMWLGLTPSILIGTLFAVMIGAEIFEAIRSSIAGEPMRY
jgi:hypothetical protein